MFQNGSSIGFKISAIYIGVSVVWILLSGYLIRHFVFDMYLVTYIEIFKGWFFVVITAGMLYKLICRYTNLLVDSEQKYKKLSEENMAAYEELLAAEEELRQQFDELLNREDKINRRNECLHALHEASVILMQESKVDGLLDTVVKKMMAMSGGQYGYIYLLDEHATHMVPKIVHGFPMDQIKASVQQGEGIIGRVWASGETVVIANYNEWEDRLKEPIYSLLRSGIGIPLKAGGRVIGVCSMNYTVKHSIDEEELKILESFAEVASILLINVHLHEALQTSQHRNQALVDALPDSIFQLDRQGRLIDYKIDKEFESIIDMKAKLGKMVQDFIPAEIAQLLMEKIEQALLTGKTQLFEYKFLSQDIVKYLEVRISKSGAKEVIAIARDITNRKEMESKLQYFALHDRVTGLYNRVYFEEKLQQFNESDHVPIGVIVCDIDGLKLVNDTFGHQAGDELLVTAANIIKDCFSADDEVARVGGDEFAIILPRKNIVEIERICSCIRENVYRYSVENTHIPISISIGIGVRTDPRQSMDDVFKAADDNMYREKLHSSQSVRSSIVQTLGKALEARDFVTDGHADRLQDLVVQLAMAVGLQDSRLSDLRLFGRFHDIGKVGVSDLILFKPGRLTDDEFEIMKRHSEIGYRIAQSSGDLAPIADWILRHHEWWNGQGYPLGIKGYDIPLACRILSIVDAYDTMTNDRPYRQAMSHDAAITELERCAGIQFDPELVREFKHLVKPQNVT